MVQLAGRQWDISRHLAEDKWGHVTVGYFPNTCFGYMGQRDSGIFPLGWVYMELGDGRIFPEC